MPEPIEEGQEVIVEEPLEQVDAPTEDESPNDDGMWRGRLKKEQEEKAALIQNVQSQLPPGWAVDGSGRLYETQPAAPTQQYVAPIPAEPDGLVDEWDNLDPAKVMAAIDRRATEKVTQAMAGIIPVLENTTAGQMSTKYNDWATIQSDVMELARQNGITSLLQAQQNPVVLNTLVLAARGMQAAKAPVVPAEDVNPAIDAMTTGGGAPGTGGSGNKYGYTAEEVAGLAAIKLTPEQAYNLQNNGSSIDIMGGNK